MIVHVYQQLAARMNRQTDRQAAMQHCVDVMWQELQHHDVSWLGFYIDQPDEPDDRRMVLGPHRDSPIGLHGVCGQALISRQACIVDDVHALGDKYIACDSRDRAELVIPLMNKGSCWGVFDLDSHTIGRFIDDDCIGCREVLIAAGFQTDKAS